MNLRLLTALAMAALLAGCASSPAPHYYSLDLAALPSATTRTVPAVLIAPASLPDALDRPQMISRHGYEVRISDQHRWAEPLRRSIPRVLANEIGGLLNSARVVAGTELPDADYRVRIDVQRLDVLSGSSVEIDILWRIEGQGSSRAGRSTLQEPVAGSGIPAQVEAQRRGLARVAAEIATQIRSLPASSR